MVELARHTAAVNKVIVKLDFRNAFSLVNRDAVLQEARLRFPGLHGAMASPAVCSMMSLF